MGFFLSSYFSFRSNSVDPRTYSTNEYLLRRERSIFFQRIITKKKKKRKRKYILVTASPHGNLQTHFQESE